MTLQYGTGHYSGTVGKHVPCSKYRQYNTVGAVCSAVHLYSALDCLAFRLAGGSSDLAELRTEMAHVERPRA